MAFVMRLKSGMEAVYWERHNPIWPDLVRVLKSHGVHNYSIFLHTETNQLFACAEIESEERWRRIASTEVCRRWWRHMAELMETHPDDSPVSVRLKEVFHLD